MVANPRALPIACGYVKQGWPVARPCLLALRNPRCLTLLVQYNPMGRRLISGHSTGELALWYACTYNFENISSVGTCLSLRPVSVQSLV
jgi:hypothetical protein